VLSTGSLNKLKLVFDVPSPDAASYYEYSVRDASNLVSGLLVSPYSSARRGYIGAEAGSGLSEPITLLLHSYNQMSGS